MNTSKNVLWLLKWANSILGNAAGNKETIAEAENSLAIKGRQKLQKCKERESVY